MPKGSDQGLPRYRSWDYVPEAMKTRTSWRRLGRHIARDAQPAGLKLVYNGARGAWPLYTIEGTIPVRKVREKPAKAPEFNRRNLLAAIFTANRSAKRFRDAATASYEASAHGLARCHSEKRAHLYQLKDRGIAYSYRNNWLSVEGNHSGLCMYSGDGFCFHSALRPCSVQLASLPGDPDPIFVEARPKGTGEMRLKDAVAMLEMLPEDLNGFHRSEVPKPPKQYRVRVREREESISDDDEDGEDSDSGEF